MNETGDSSLCSSINLSPMSSMDGVISRNGRNGMIDGGRRKNSEWTELGELGE